MNKEEKRLKSTRDQLLAQLKDCDDKLDAIKSERRRKAEIKRTYKPNHIEPEYELDWRGYAITLETSIDKLAQELPNYNEIREFLTQAKNANSYKLPVDPAKVWNCPDCGESICLYVGDYGSDMFDHKYAVTCGSCGYIGPKISDYGEAWCEFEDWLRKKGYLKDEN